MNKFLRLIRFDKPIGTLLLGYPTAWALWIAHPNPSWTILLYFLIGTFCMRAAGCVFNDITDRHIDLHVHRTCLRPLTNGEVSLSQAFAVALGLIFISFIMVLQLPSMCIFEAFLALLITGLYPFCKRFFKAPQLILSLAFSMGIPMAYTAQHQPLSTSCYLLCFINGLWILLYDTIYAMADEHDDRRIGIYSTAILFGKYRPLILWACFMLMTLGWIILGTTLMPLSLIYALGLMTATFYLGCQLYRLHTEPSVDPITIFRLQSHYGLIVLITLILSLNYTINKS